MNPNDPAYDYGGYPGNVPGHVPYQQLGETSPQVGAYETIAGRDSSTTSDLVPAPDPTLPWVRRVLLRVEVGSTAHGTGLPGAEDYDEQGIMSIPTLQTVGLPVRSEADETIVYRPGRGAGDRSGPGDYDLTVHSARKMARLCASGNPSALMTLFGPVRFSTQLGDQFRELAPAFHHRGAIDRFLGYSKSQRERLLGVRGGKHTNRPELVEVHGFDTKYAMHMVRLGIQGIDYAVTGRVELPIPDPWGETLRAIRRGEHSLEEVLAVADMNEMQLQHLKETLDIPQRPDLVAINLWVRRVFDWQRDQERHDV